MLAFKEKYEGRDLIFALGSNVSEEELQAMKVVKTFVVKKGRKTVCVGGEIENGGRRHFPIIYFSTHHVEFYCGGEVPDELKDELKGVLSPTPSGCWRGKTDKERNIGCKHALCLIRAIQTQVAPQVIQLGEEDTNDDELLLDLKATAFKAHLLLWGEPGGGKTWTAFRLAEWAERSSGAETIVIQGSPALEAADLLGMWIKKGDNVGWEDGALTRAFRLAASGKKVVLLVDELPRINVREQGILVAPLLPTPKGLILFNPLNGEEIVAPPQNLWVIATGNLGEGFASSRLLDGALAERFLIIEVKASKEKLRRLLTSALLSRGWDTNIVGKLLSLRDAAEELTERGELPAAPSLRVFLRAIELAPALESLPKWVAMCHSQVMLSPEGKELWERLVKKVF